MNEDEQKRVCVEGSSKVDWLSILPESLLCKVLLNLPTTDVVKTSVLSKRWINLWRYVPGLDLYDIDFLGHKTFISFVDAFLDFNNESYMESFKLNLSGFDVDYAPEIGCVTRWINIVVDRRVKHLQVQDDSAVSWGIEIPSNLYTCESLVSLKLRDVPLSSPKFVSLPSLKVLDLNISHFANELDLETFISGCPVLDSLVIERSLRDGIGVLRVCSQSLLSFTHVSQGYIILVPSAEDDLVVEIDAPRLQYMRLSDCFKATFILNNTSSLVEADIDTVFNIGSENYFDPNDLQKRKIIRSFLEGISCVKDMTITSKTLEIFYHYSICEELLLFRSLSFLRVSFINYEWEMLSIFLESCPNLKSLVVAYNKHRGKEGLRIISGPRCLLSSLEFVDIETPLIRETKQIELVSYFLENSATLQKLTVRLDACMKTEESTAIINELHAIPRLSSSCQVIVL